MLVLFAEGDPVGRIRRITFRQALQQLGWTGGRNLSIVYRWAIGDADRAKNAVQELIALAPDVIVANGTVALAALHRAKSNIPVIFIAVTDPVGAGYVQSLARPGGNITGFSSFEAEIGGKWLELMRQVAPTVQRVAVILDPPFKGFAAISQVMESTAPKLGLALNIVPFHEGKDDLETAIASFAQQPRGGLVALPTPINVAHRHRIIALAARYRLPAVYPFTILCSDGGLLCYGFDPNDLWRRAATYVDRILKGERPADLPVQFPTKFELAINRRTAKALGLTIPPMLLLLADKVIE